MLFRSGDDSRYLNERGGLLEMIYSSSEYLVDVYRILEIYVRYKLNKDKQQALNALNDVVVPSEYSNWDYLMLAKAFFAKRTGETNIY